MYTHQRGVETRDECPFTKKCDGKGREGRRNPPL